MAVYKSITFDNRKKIAALYAKGMSISDISDEVGVALRTLYVELKRGATGKLDQNQRPAYDPVLAQRTYQENISLADLQNPSSLGYARIYDRILEMCPIRLKLAGDSRRTQNAQERRDKAKRLLGLERT